MVYVDDFKMAGPAENVDAMWEAFEQLPPDTRLELGTPEPVGHFLGCGHEPFEGMTADGTPVRGMKYDMHKFVDQSLDLYQRLAGSEFEYKEVNTPFIDEDKGVANPARTPHPGPGLVCPFCTEAWPDHMFERAENEREAAEIVKRLREAQKAQTAGETRTSSASTWETTQTLLVTRLAYWLPSQHKLS